MQRMRSVVSKYEKAVTECKCGLEDGDMIKLQLAMDAIEELKEMGVGPRILEDSTLQRAKSDLEKWAPYRVYLHRLGQYLQEGPMAYTMYWLVLVEGELLSRDLETAATVDLARLGQEGA